MALETLVYDDWDGSGNKDFHNKLPKSTLYLKSGFIYIDTDANVADRYLRLYKYDKDGKTVYLTTSGLVQANEKGWYGLFSGSQTSRAVDHASNFKYMTIAMPEGFFLGYNEFLRIQVTGVQATDLVDVFIQFKRVYHK